VTVATQSLHRHAFWIYGVIVGLAIKEALVAVLPHLFKPPFEPLRTEFYEICKLLIFLIVITRFYLGSAYFFEEAHCSDNCVSKYPQRSYAMDFLFGLVHFLLLFVWAITIGHDIQPRVFNRILWLLLLYDVAWYLACRKYDTRHLMKLWTALNGFTFVLALVTYLVAKQWLSPETAELLGFIPVLIASAIDITELITEKQVIRRALADLVRMPHSP
jgi:hypothetical protein